MVLYLILIIIVLVRSYVPNNPLQNVSLELTCTVASESNAVGWFLIVLHVQDIQWPL